MDHIDNSYRWVEGAVVYHIYPRSFQDSNGDGVGDLPGIIARLDYLKDLGVTALWLSPFYPSPMADFGYDVADYCEVNSLFGTLDDFKTLLAEAERRDIRIIIDLVPNHTSDEHVWFKESRRSRTNSYADWYIWHDAKEGSAIDKPEPPNNWLDALTGQSVWEWDETRQQFYLHSFHKRQPDLNWANSAVREAIKDVMRFWLKLGVDGFRIDAVYWMAKDPLFRNDTPEPNYAAGSDAPYEALTHNNSRGWPALYAYLAEMSQVLKEQQYQTKQRFMVTEAYPEGHNSVAAYMAFYEGVDPEVAAPFNFEGIGLPWSAQPWRHFLQSFHKTLTTFNPLCLPSYAFSNHDQPRLASRIGESAARSAAVMLLTLPGMVFIYYGEELGMQDVAIPPDQVQDPNAIGDPVKGQGRDPERTPMQWSTETNAGFTTAAQPWLPISADYTQRNITIQQQDPHSLLSLYKKLTHLRNNSSALRYGHIDVLDLPEQEVLGYVRKTNNEQYLVLVNFAARPVSCQPNQEIEKLVLSSNADTLLTTLSTHEVTLQPHEAAILKVHHH